MSDLTSDDLEHLRDMLAGMLENDEEDLVLRYPPDTLRMAIVHDCLHHVDPVRFASGWYQLLSTEDQRKLMDRLLAHNGLPGVDEIFQQLAEGISDWVSVRRIGAAIEQQADDYHAALARILRWVKENWSAEIEELEEILADAGFEIDHDDSLVIHGERVRDDE